MFFLFSSEKFQRYVGQFEDNLETSFHYKFHSVHRNPALNEKKLVVRFPLISISN